MKQIRTEYNCLKNIESKTIDKIEISLVFK